MVRAGLSPIRAIMSGLSELKSRIRASFMIRSASASSRLLLICSRVCMVRFELSSAPDDIVRPLIIRKLALRIR